MISKTTLTSIITGVIGIMLITYGHITSVTYLEPKWYFYGLGVSPAFKDATLSYGSTSPVLSKYIVFGIGFLWLASIFLTIALTKRFQIKKLGVFVGRCKHCKKDTEWFDVTYTDLKRNGLLSVQGYCSECNEPVRTITAKLATFDIVG